MGKKQEGGALLPEATITAPLDRLYVAPENPRVDQPVEDLDALTANIAAYDLLQQLTAYDDDAGRFAVVGGRRRLAALNKIKAEKIAHSESLDLGAIPLKLIPRELAAQVALAEQTQRVALSITAESAAWNRMTMQGAKVDDIAKAFGTTPRFVQGRIRLACLHPPIFEALAKNEITLDIAQAFAGAMPARQERVWNKLHGASKQRDALNLGKVKSELARNTLLAGDALARFVTEAAYVAAGGVVEHELFTTADRSRWINTALAEKLAAEKLKAAAKEIEAEGFVFVEAAAEFPHGRFVDGNLGKKRKANAEEAARLKAIEQRCKAIDKEIERIEDGEGTWAEKDALMQPLTEEGELLDAEKERIEAQLQTFDDKAKEKSGVVVTISADGGLLVQRGMIAPKARSTASKKSAAKSSNGATVNHNKQDPEISRDTLEETTRIASTIVGRTLAQHPDLAVAALIASLARAALEDGRRWDNDDVLDVTVNANAEPNCDLLSDKRDADERKAWLAKLGKGGAGWMPVIVSWPQAEQMKLLAFCAGAAVDAVEYVLAHSSPTQKRRRARLASLARDLNVSPAAHFIPDAKYLSGYGEKTLKAFAAELGIDSAGAKDKAALAAMVADKAKAQAWTPPLLRELLGIKTAAKPTPAKAATKTAAPAKKPAAKKIAKAPVKKVAKKAAGKARS